MEPKQKIVFIVNPISGTHNKQAILEVIDKELNKDIFEPQICYTQYAGHATELARKAVQGGASVVVAIGGDGTVNETGRGLVQTDTALGIIPCGSGNGLARHLQIPLNTSKAVKILNAHKTESLDYGVINNIPFFCTCGLGFDAFVSFKFAMAGKRGLRTYIENTLKEGLRYKPETYEIISDEGTVRYKAFLIACANASQYGNDAYIAPQASMSDGLMDVTIMEPFTMLEAPQIAIQLFNKTLNHNSHIKTFRCKKLTISRKTAGVIHYDGNPITTGNTIEVEMIHRGINMVVNERAVPTLGSYLQVFSEYFNDLSNITGDLKERNHRFLSIHKELLKKLRDDNTLTKI